MTSSGPRLYTQCGLRIRSIVDLPLPEVGGDAFDVDVTWGPDLDDSDVPPAGEVVVEFVPDDEPWWYTGAWTGSHYLLRFRQCGEFVVSADLSRVQVRRSRSQRAGLLPILMAGTVSSFLLGLRGSTVLHASAVAVRGTALAFVGPSGQGKTTLATLLCTSGAALVTDDVLTVDAGPPATCVGGAAELRLREAATPLAAAAPSSARRTTVDDRLALSVPMAPLGAFPLGAIVVPDPSREATELRIAAVPPSKALFAFLAFPRVHGWTRRDVLDRDFGVLARLVSTVPVYVATIPWGPPFDPDIAPQLERLVPS